MKKSMILVGMMSIGYTYAQTSNTGKIGINTDTPSATLNVKSKNDTNSPKNLELENQSGEKLVTVLNNGNVGIGTDIPTRPLEVIKTTVNPNNGYNGVANFLAPNIEEGGNAHITIGKEASKFNAGSIDFVYKKAGSSENGIGFNLHASGLNTDSSGPYILFAQGNGFVGIGTTNPVQKLDVRGNIVIDMPNDRFGFLRYNRSEKIRWDVGMLNNDETGENTGSDFYIRGFNDEGMSIHTPFVIKRKTGYIGIGHSSQTDANAATERLDINNGNVRVRNLPANIGANTDKIVVVDNTGVLKSVDRSTMNEVKATTTGATCSDTNLGAIHFKEMEIDGKKAGTFGFCTKQDGVAMWVYLTNGGNILQGTGVFGSGL